MSAGRLLLATAVAVFGLTLAGCVDGGPYYGAYTYSDDYGPYYGPGYYSGVVYGGYYTSHRRHYDRRHHHRYSDRHHRSGSYDHRPRYGSSGDRSNAADHDRSRTWRHRGDPSPHRAAIRSGSSQVSRTSYKNSEHRSRDRRRWDDERK